MITKKDIHMQPNQNILQPTIIDDKYEGKHALIDVKNMRQLLALIKDGGHYAEDIGTEGSSRESWVYGTEVVGRDALLNALTVGKTSNKILRMYNKMRTELEIKAGVSKFLGTGLSCKRKRVIRDDGDDLSMSRLMGGNDNYWGTIQRNSQRRNVRIGMNVGIACGHSEGDFARLGASLAVMSDVLTKMGYAVEVIAYDFVRYSGRRDWKHWAISVPIKKPNEPLDVHRLLSAGLSGFFRDILFGVMEMDVNRFNSSKGQQTETSDFYKKHLNLIHTVEHRFCKTIEKAVDGLADMMQTLADKPKWWRS